jgi:hypothetical protein
MTQPCDKDHRFDKIDDQLEKIASALIAVAVQGERVQALEKKSDDQESRLRKIEDQPRKFLIWIGGIISVVVSAWVIFQLNFGG